MGLRGQAGQPDRAQALGGWPLASPGGAGVLAADPGHQPGAWPPHPFGKGPGNRSGTLTGAVSVSPGFLPCRNPGAPEAGEGGR